MTELEKYELVNSCESIEELENAIDQLSEYGRIEGRTDSFSSINMVSFVTRVVKENANPNLLTRKYGIRQQALYLKHYNK